MPFIIGLNAATATFWCFIAKLFEMKAFLFLFGNWFATLICSLIFYQIRKCSARKGKFINRHESINLMLTTVFTSWSGPILIQITACICWQLVLLPSYQCWGWLQQLLAIIGHQVSFIVHRFIFIDHRIIGMAIFIIHQIL